MPLALADIADAQENPAPRLMRTQPPTLAAGTEATVKQVVRFAASAYRLQWHGVPFAHPSSWRPSDSSSDSYDAGPTKTTAVLKQQTSRGCQRGAFGIVFALITLRSPKSELDKDHHLNWTNTLAKVSVIAR